ncbi:MAG: Ku protein [bacterium]
MERTPQIKPAQHPHRRCGSRLKYEKVCSKCGRKVPNEQIVKGYEYGEDQYVILDDKDFEKLRLESTKTIEIVQFVDAAEIDPVYFDTTYFLIPDGAVGADAYALLRQAMREKGKIAIGKVVMRNKELDGCSATER